VSPCPLRLPAVFLGVAIALAAPTTARAPLTPAGLHFHHLQLRVADPAAAMATYTRVNGCAEAILQGLGVGVRCGSTYLLFDRDDDPAPAGTMSAAVTVGGSGDHATVRARLAVADPAAVGAWLRRTLGVDPSPDVTFVAAAGASGRALPDRVSHLAFGAIDPGPAIAALHAAGATFVTEGGDASIVAGPGGVPIEIVRDAGTGPDAYWCPMHPDVRSPTPGVCPRCGMTLVPMPPPVFGDYRLQVDVAPLAPGRAHLTLRLIDPATNTLVTRLIVVHERPIHLFLVSRDLTSFQHVHPEPAPDGSFALDVAWPAPGEYMLFADFYPAGGTPQLLQTLVATDDYRGPAFPAPPALAPDAGAAKNIDGVRVTLAAAPLVAAREQTLTFSLADPTTGAPIADLEPYLGVPGHLLVVSADLTDGLHSHPFDVHAMGPDVKFNVTFPRPGLFKLWVQFQRGGRVITAPFVVRVGGAGGG